MNCQNRVVISPGCMGPCTGVAEYRCLKQQTEWIQYICADCAERAYSRVVELAAWWDQEPPEFSELHEEITWPTNS